MIRNKAPVQADKRALPFGAVPIRPACSEALYRFYMRHRGLPVPLTRNLFATFARQSSGRYRHSRYVESHSPPPPDRYLEPFQRTRAIRHINEKTPAMVVGRGGPPGGPHAAHPCLRNAARQRLANILLLVVLAHPVGIRMGDNGL